jgi:hypothetical protein
VNHDQNLKHPIVDIQIKEATDDSGVEEIANELS